MPSDPVYKGPESGAASPPGTSSYSERRKVPRYPFIADAEIVELSSGMRFKARVSELSQHGCYIDALNPVPNGLNVRLKIFKEPQEFETEGRVIYSHPTMGMGIVFANVSPEQKRVLDGWLMQLGG